MKTIASLILLIILFSCSSDDKISSSLVDIPDANFEQALIDFGTDTDNVVNGQISIQDALATTFLSIGNAGINDLTGIEAFINLTELNCSSNNLSTLDVSQNTALEYLDCDLNNLSTLDVSQNTALIELICEANNLTTLDSSKNMALEYLDCEANNLSTLNLGQNMALEFLYCNQNNLSTLDPSQNTALKVLDCSDNSLSTLDLSQNTALKRLDCSDNNLTSLNIKNGNNTNITQFNAINNDPNLSICVDAVPLPNNLIINGIDTGVSFATICN